jgi:hypothetical protein
LEHRGQQAVIADLELRGVDPDRYATGSRSPVIASQGSLSPLVQLAFSRQRQRMRRNDDTFP